VSTNDTTATEATAKCKRRIIQISTTAQSAVRVIHALCDDGTIWEMTGTLSPWLELDLPPGCGADAA
jgi:hypothetical protein